MNVYVGYDDRSVAKFDSVVNNLRMNAGRDINVYGLRTDELIDSGFYRRHICRPDERLFYPWQYSKFLVPWIENYTGFALYMDCTVEPDDYMSYLSKIRNKFAVLCSKNTHWSTIMLFNCAHEACKRLHPETINIAEADYLCRFEWAQYHEIGSLNWESRKTAV